MTEIWACHTAVTIYQLTRHNNQQDFYDSATQLQEPQISHTTDDDTMRIDLPRYFKSCHHFFIRLDIVLFA
jgi:hypothetical protein